MSKKKKLGLLAGSTAVTTATTAHAMKKEADKTTYTAELMSAIKPRKMGFYEKYIKRGMDVICASAAILCFSPIYAGVALLVKIKLGSPVIFTQDRPGLVDKDGRETIFKMYKFRTMTDERDEEGNLLPDEVRLTKFGAWLRKTSLDELPEAFNILNGTMSVIGPRPQLVRDMVFMTDEQRMRHTAKPGLSGLAQVNGRNAITWEDKLEWDQKYIKKVGLIEDINIFLETVKKAFIKQEGISQDDMATAEDFGDYLLRTEKIDEDSYAKKKDLAKMILSQELKICENIELIEHEPFSVAMSVYKNDNPDFLEQALSSIIDIQTIVPDEVILVVDGPVSNEIDNVIKNYQKKYIFLRVIRLEENGGLGNALKIATESAKYNLIARMDSDDISLPNRFEEQLKYFMLHPTIDVVGGDIEEFINDESNIVGRRRVPQKNDEIREYMKKRCAFNHMSVMYKKTTIQAVGGYQDWFWNEDYFLWIRMWLNNAEFANTGTTLVKVRVGKEMYQRRGGNKYFQSEKKLQTYMLTHGMINRKTYCINIIKRWIVQRVLTNRLRGWVFRTFAREK